MKSKLYIGFPGIGKTTFIKQTPGFIDLDYGYLRLAMGHGFGGDQSDVVSVITKLAEMYSEHGGYIVVTNEPSLAPKFQRLGFEVMFIIPRDIEAVKSRVLERDGPNNEFAKALLEKGDKWLNGWISKAAEFKCKIKAVDFFSDAFSDQRRKEEIE